MSKSNLINGLLDNITNIISGNSANITSGILSSSLPSTTHSISPSINPGNLPSIITSSNPSSVVSFSNSPVVFSNAADIVSKLLSMGSSIVSSASPTSIINVVSSELPSISSLIASPNTLPDISSNLTDIVSSNLPSVIPNSNLPNIPFDNLTDIISSNTTNIISSNSPSAIPNISNLSSILPDINISNITNIVSNNLPNIPIDVTVNIPEIKIHDPGWVNDDAFKFWMMTTSGVLVLLFGCVAIALGVFVMYYICYGNTNHNQPQPIYPISVINSGTATPYSEKETELVNMLKQHGTKNDSKLVGNPSYGSNPYDDEL